MSDEKDLKNAQNMYSTILAALDSINWRYTRHDENMVITFSVSGDDIPMELLLAVDAKRQLIRLMSRLPFKFSQEKRVEAAIAIGQTNYRFADGSFDFDFDDGSVTFRMTNSFKESIISKEAVLYLIHCATYTIDEYNDKFLMLNKGHIQLEEFLQQK